MEYTIYSIICKDVDVPGIFVGSTRDLEHRKRKHKFDSNDDTKNHIKLYKVIDETGGWDNWEFKILESFTCKTQTDAFIKERYYIDKLQADLNMRNPHTTIEESKEKKAEFYVENKEKILETKKQFYVKNKDKISEYHKQWYVKNKDKISEYQNHYNSDNAERINRHKAEKIYCHPCGLYHRRGEKAKHFKSQKHIDNLAKITDV